MTTPNHGATFTTSRRLQVVLLHFRPREPPRRPSQVADQQQLAPDHACVPTNCGTRVQRWVRTCRRELLDRTLTWNQRHLLHALREYERFYHLHRPHQGITNVPPPKPLPEPITDPDQLAR